MNNDLTQARKLIKACQETQNPYLDLGNCGITDLDDIPELFECRHLETLILSKQWREFEDGEILIKESTNQGPENSLTHLPSSLAQLTRLKKLVCNGFAKTPSKITDISVIGQLTQLQHLDLTGNKITDISPLSNLKKLKFLDLYFSEVKDISPLKDLTNLQYLDLREGWSDDISSLANLINLIYLDLYWCRIRDISPLVRLKKLRYLLLRDNQLEDISPLSILESLEVLNLSENSIKDISPISKLTELKSLNLNANYLTDISPLANLTKLETLGLVDNQITDLKPLANLRSLQTLNLRYNQAPDISPLKNLTSLRKLLLDRMQISDITPLAELTELQELYLSENKISDITALSKLTKLELLHLYKNQIIDIDFISVISELKNLKSLSISENPFEKRYDLILNTRENHLDVLQNFLTRQKEEEKIQITLPAKVMLLGNHASGKSSLLHYLKKRKLGYKGKSTHLLSIENYYVNGKVADNLPDAIFYDFGGQDYYHGIYRVFMSIDAIYLLLWNKEGNHNQTITDSNELLSRNYQISYWLGQKDYFEKQKIHSDDPTLLIQTYADKDKRIGLATSNHPHKINNEFYISLKTEYNDKVNLAALAYLKASTDVLIKEKQVKKEEPIWYKEFIKFILEAKKTNNHKPTDIEKDLLPMYKLHKAKDNDKRLDSLKTELSQFHKKGMILYYPELFSDLAWLNPSAFSAYVHKDIFSKKSISASKGIIPADKLKKLDDKILKLLKHQKVLFEHNNSGVKEYIIPNYLPLAEEKENFLDYELLTFEFGYPLFTLKFNDFLPIGLVNQLICWFGEFTDKKKFWRNQLLFTFQESKVLIRLDFEYLEIKVFIVSKHSTQIRSIAKYIFYCIIGLYWDLDLMDYNSFDQPTSNDLESEVSGTSSKSRQEVLGTCDYQSIGLYISLDDQYFVNFKELCKIKDEGRIGAFTINEQREFKDTQREIPVYPFHIFTTQQLTKMKKVFVSYSHDDIDYRRELQKYLVNLERENIIEIWQDGLIEPGEKWDIKIKDSLEKADIIILLVSQSFIASNYVHEVEMRKSLLKVEEGTAKILPVLLKNCDWQQWKVLPQGVNEDEIKNNDGNIGSYQFFPMDENQRLKAVNRWEYQEDVWTELTNYIRKMSYPPSS
ncbi:leucine-rich repeat domain-containing protein [Catalinimonas sp. 4WD22]|uniref:leucine-rich repeat domain-containing protein n=1 Tax=Catalinimonas locisalis TaxID=3133978 RepID=UPI0031012204